MTAPGNKRTRSSNERRLFDDVSEARSEDVKDTGIGSLSDTIQSDAFAVDEAQRAGGAIEPVSIEPESIAQALIATALIVFLVSVILITGAELRYEDVPLSERKGYEPKPFECLALISSLVVCCASFSYAFDSNRTAGSNALSRGVCICLAIIFVPLTCIAALLVLLNW